MGDSTSNHFIDDEENSNNFYSHKEKKIIPSPMTSYLELQNKRLREENERLRGLIRILKMEKEET